MIRLELIGQEALITDAGHVKLCHEDNEVFLSKMEVEAVYHAVQLWQNEACRGLEDD
jgi:hypothetical protein